MKFLSTELFGYVAADWQRITTAVLPIVGLAVILFCIASFFFPFGQKFKETKQTISGFGLNLEISVLSLFLLIGFLLSSSGVFLYVTSRNSSLADLNTQISELRAKVDAANERADRAERFAVRLNLVLPAKVDQVNVGNLECWYIMASHPDQPLQAPVGRGLTNRSVRVTLLDIARDDVLEQLELREQGSQKTIASTQNVYPLQPVIQLD